MKCINNDGFTILGINSQEKWKTQSIFVDDKLIISADGLRLRSFFEYAFDHIIGKPQGLIEPTDLAVGRCGTLFILDAQQSRIARYDPPQNRLEWIECIGGPGDLPTQFMDPKGIAVTDRTLYVADTGNQRVIAFARLNWQVRWIVNGSAEITGQLEPFGNPTESMLSGMQPCDLAVDAEENLYVLDCANLVIHKFDPGGRWAGTFGKNLLAHPVTIAIDNNNNSDLVCLLLNIQANNDRQRCAEKVIQILCSSYNKMIQVEQDEFVKILTALVGGTVVDQLAILLGLLQQGDLDAIEIVRSHLVPIIQKYQTLLYVLDAHLMKVLKFTKYGEYAGVAIDLISTDLGFIEPFGLALDQQGNIYLGDQHQLVAGEEDDRFIYKFDPAGKLQQPPITAYRGSTDGLVMDHRFNIYVLNGEREDITILGPQERFPAKAIFISTAFDSTISNCSWHKLVLDRQLPEKSQIRVSYLISEAPKSHEEIKSLADYEWSKSILNPQDALILGSTGRYLWLRLELTGDGQVTPTVNYLKVYFQRISYLRYLPAVYYENELSRDFLERFLSLFETFFYDLETKIEQISSLFDPLAVHADFIPWLAQWLAATLDDNWPIEKQRQFLLNAANLYKLRGTRRGFEKLIELFTGEIPIIFESFQLCCIKDDKLQQFYQRLFCINPFHFCVLLKPTQVQSKGQYYAIKRLVDADKPAHTEASVRWLQPWFYLDMHTYLGMNTQLSKPVILLEQQSVISRDTVLGDIEETGQVERRSRVNVDTTLT